MFFILALSIISTAHVNPIERNLDEIVDTNFSKTISSLKQSDQDARWVTNNLVLENYAVANGARSLSGVYVYPQLDMWRKLDPTRKDEYRYNRYAHVIFTFDDSQVIPKLFSPSLDMFLVRISPCSNFFAELNVVYFYNTGPINSKCLQPIAEVATKSAATIFIYKRTLDTSL